MGMSDAFDPRITGHMAGESVSSSQGLDRDGFPTFQQIQSMSGEKIDEVFENVSNSPDLDSLDFLAKVGVAAQRMPDVNTKLFYKAMDLYVPNKILSTGDFLDPMPDMHTEAQKEEIIRSFKEHAEKFTSNKEELSQVIITANDALFCWIIYKQTT